MQYSKAKSGIDLTNTVIRLDVCHGIISLIEHTQDYPQSDASYIYYGAADESARNSDFDARVSYLFRLIQHIAISCYCVHPRVINDILLPLDEYRHGLITDFGTKLVPAVNHTACAHARPCPFCNGEPFVEISDNMMRVVCSSCHGRSSFAYTHAAALAAWNGVAAC